jgi:tryptophan 2,3-dioxygenase
MTSLSYADYLKLDELLALQHVRVPPELSRRVWASENFFIIAHQCCELWLSQTLVDLHAACDELWEIEPQLELVVEHLARAQAILVLLQQHVLVLDQLPAACFAVFRTYLEAASGAQSARFYKLDLMLGGKSGPSPLEEALTSAVRAEDLDLVGLWRKDLRSGALLRIADLLLDIGQSYWKWKACHLALVARVLGGESGTGGSSGVEYLLRRMSMPFGNLREAQRLAYYASDEVATPVGCPVAGKDLSAEPA